MCGIWALIKANPKEKIKDYELRQNGISPENLRRWFNKHYGITFHTYRFGFLLLLLSGGINGMTIFTLDIISNMSLSIHTHNDD